MADESLLVQILDEIRAIKSDISGLKDDASGLKNDVSQLKSDVSELKAGQQENYQILKALEHKADVNKAEHDKMLMDIAKIQGYQKDK